MRFPIKESAVYELAGEVTAGLDAHPEVYPSPPVDVSRLQAALEAYSTAKSRTNAARSRYEESIRVKDDALATLKRFLKSDLRYAENTVDFHDDFLKLLGWSGRRAKHRVPPPGQPRSLAAPKQGEGFLVLHWKKPIDGGKPAVFTIQRREVGADTVWRDIATAMETEIRLENQPRGVELEFHVLAINKAGEGPPSNTVMAVL